VKWSLSLFHCFHICALANEVLNPFRVNIMPPNTEKDSLWLLEHSFTFPFSHRRLGSTPTYGTSHLLLAHIVTREDPWTSCRSGSWLCSPLGLVPHNFPPVEALEFRPSSLILVPLLCGLENHGIVGSTLSAERFLIIDLINQGHLLISEALDRWWSEEASANSSRTGRAYEVVVLRSHHVCKYGLQLFNIV
jgi:hypothetical protein